MIDIHPIPAFSDNYIWALFDEQGHCVVVDPGDAAPVEAYLQREGLTLTAILVTHHHPDHVGGISALLSDRDIPVLGPAGESIPGLTDALEDGDSVDLEAPELHFRVLHVPGHTLGHIAYFAPDMTPPALLCGDTLFAAGCGRLFEGTPGQMHDSLRRLAALPPETRVFCAHEYTTSNLRFAQAVTPDDQRVAERVAAVAQLRARQRPTVPSTLAEERATNPFMRVDDANIQAAVARHGCDDPTDPVSVFAALRAWKDAF